jgi:RimJ/RimL family protein N-acetyltransferase
VDKGVKSMNCPNFSTLEKLNVKRFPNEELYQFVAVRDLEINDGHCETIFNICNEPEIYKWLFGPSEYTKEKAIGFLNWAKDGWRLSSHFVFLIITNENEIVGAFDVKNNDLDAGEIGYWISSKHSGLATSGLDALKKIASTAGYRKLFAQTKEGNEKSIKVLIRNQFIEDKRYNKDPNCSKAFVIGL